MKIKGKTVVMCDTPFCKNNEKGVCQKGQITLNYIIRSHIAGTNIEVCSEDNQVFCREYEEKSG